MPDIDVGVQSDRRDELIRCVERTYTEAHAAMVANVITYRARSALRDAAKALAYPLDLVNRLTLTSRLSHHADAEELRPHECELRQVISAFPDSSDSSDSSDPSNSTNPSIRALPGTAAPPAGDGGAAPRPAAPPLAA